VLFSSSAWLSFAISAGVTISLALALFYIGGFGGADSKALICLAVCLPTAPFTPLLNAGGLLPFEMGFFPLIVFVDMLFLACLSVVYFAAHNFAFWLRGGELFSGKLPMVKKLTWFFTGFKLPVQVFPFWVKPLEPVSSDGEVWVSSGLPMLVFLFAGFVFALLFGNIFWMLLSSF
jgi:preflagellin peptidase FlaK